MKMRFNKCRQLAVAAAIVLVTGTASADLILSGPITGNTLGPQSTSNPCVIAGTTCQQPAGMGYNNFDATGNVDSYDMYSTTPTATLASGDTGTPYTVSQLTGSGGVNSNTFVVAIDINTTGAASETLQLFEVIINGSVAYNYVGPIALAPVNNNGNGYADWTLGLIDLSTYGADDTVSFHAVWSGAVDGPESFFLVASDGTTPPTGLVPEPATLALVGLALVGMGATRRGRKA
jgi:hypothetical protein